MTNVEPPRYVIEDAAAVDLQDAVSWYQTQQRGLGDELLLEFGQRLSAALEQPGIGTLAGHTRRGAAIRRYRLHRFSRYAILVAVIDGVPTVLAFEHSSRRPNYWSGRIP
jgi:toxin ParE1/3/4